MLLLWEGGIENSGVLVSLVYSCSSHGSWWYVHNSGCAKYALGLRTVSSCAVLQACIGSGDQSTAGLHLATCWIMTSP